MNVAQPVRCRYGLEKTVVATPWRGFVTSVPTDFLLSLHGTTVGAFVRVTNLGQVAHLGNLTTMDVVQRIGTKGFPARVRLYRLNLEPWQGTDPPELCLHPLAIAHLFITEQIPRGDIMSLLGAEDRVAQTQSTLVDRRCGLTWQLGVKQVRVTLRTDFDVLVRPDTA